MKAKKIKKRLKPYITILIAMSVILIGLTIHFAATNPSLLISVKTIVILRFLFLLVLVLLFIALRKLFKIEEKKYQENISELTELKERFEHISTATNDAIWEWNAQTNEVWGNEAYLKLLENNPLGLSNFDNFVSKVHPDDIGGLFEGFNQTVETKKLLINGEFRLQGKNNEWLTFLNRALVIYDENQKPLKVVGIMQDITLQTKAQNNIIKEKEILNTLIQNLPGIFYLFNKEGKYLKWNDNLLLISGYTEEEIKLMHHLDFFDPSEKEILIQKITNTYVKGTEHTEALLVTKQNKKIPFYFTGTYVDYYGEDCIMGLGIDISDKINSQKKLRNLAAKNEENIEIIRTKIAREIHDVLGQQLTGLRMNLSWLVKKNDGNSDEFKNKIKDSIQLTEEISKQVRNIATELRPGILDDLGIIAAIEWQTEMFEKRSFLSTKLLTNTSYISISGEKATAIFRIYQECFNNILKHAQATHVDINIHVNDAFFEMVVADNGIGFIQKDIEHKKTLGIMGMQERIELLNGKFKIDSFPQKGTRLSIKIPLFD